MKPLPSFKYIVLALSPFLLIQTAYSQQTPSVQIEATTEDIAEFEAAQTAREDAETRIEEDLVKMNDMTEALSKLIGRLHYLRTLCFGREDQLWRDYMGGLLEIEVPDTDDETKRDYLTNAFNTGYYLEEARFSECNNSVSIEAAALAENGRRLASMLGDPYRDF